MTQRIICALVVLFTCGLVQAQNAQPTKFNFSFARSAPAGFTQVKPDAFYSREAGFGFDPGTAVMAMDHGIFNDAPFYFHVALPEGNYKVTVTFGNDQRATDNTVYAELRRLMLQSVHTEPGKTETRSFIVNVRTPAIPGGGQVKINARERNQEPWAWDDRLSLEFNGAHPGIESMSIESVDVPTVYLLGDSTVCDQPVEPYNSWGQMLTRFLKPEVAVCNGAESGDSIAPALGAGRFDKFWKQMKTGDYLFIQFGHNDMKSNAPQRLKPIPTICARPSTRRAWRDAGFRAHPSAGEHSARRIRPRSKIPSRDTRKPFVT